jgi:hypothetical protein
VELQAFEQWLKALGPDDRLFLEKHSEWQKAYRQICSERKLKAGFVERTMEILEGGSESET